MMPKWEDSFKIYTSKDAVALWLWWYSWCCCKYVFFGVGLDEYCMDNDIAAPTELFGLLSKHENQPFFFSLSLYLFTQQHGISPLQKIEKWDQRRTLAG
jgi:hypothetical protein